TTPVVEAKPGAHEPAPSFAEKIETLRNSDLELHLTNRGGGIKEAVLLRQIAEKDQRVVLNSNQTIPIGAIIEQPATPALAEFTGSAVSDSVVQFERTTDEQLTIRKKFQFQKSSEEKDNYVIEMNVDLENRSDKPYQNGGYCVGPAFRYRARAGPKAARYRGGTWNAGISVAARTNIQRAFRDLRWPKTLPPPCSAPAQRS